jgi:hypothetical protein
VVKQLRSNLGDTITVERVLCSTGAVRETITMSWTRPYPAYEQPNPLQKQGVRAHYSRRL